MMYARSHLAKNIPTFLEKNSKLTTNHHSQEFLDARKVRLDEFMTKLSVFPGILQVPGIQSFMGTDSV